MRELSDAERAMVDRIWYRYPITEGPVRYMLFGLNLSEAVADILASLAMQGYGEARIVAAAEALAGVGVTDA